MRFATQWLLRITVILFVLVLAGPELGIGLELFAITELLGAELFVISFLVGIRLLFTACLLAPILGFLERIDPYFFIPTRNQIALAPGIVAHAIPGFVVTYVGWILLNTVPAEI